MKENQKLKEKLYEINDIIRRTLYYTRKNKGIEKKYFIDTIGISGKKLKDSEFNPKKLNVALFFILCKELDIDINKLLEKIYSVIDI